jgi:hypothetical protein
MKLPSSDSLRVDVPFALLAALMAAVACAIGAAPYLLNAGPSVKEQGSQLEERTHAAAEADAEVVALRARVESLAAKQRSAVLLQPQSALFSRINAITDLATNCSATISQITPQIPQAPIAITDKDKAVIVPIKIAGTCTYENATRLLAEISERFPDTAVTAVRLTAAPAEAAPTAAFAIDLAWYAGPANSAGSTDPAPKSR